MTRTPAVESPRVIRDDRQALEEAANAAERFAAGASERDAHRRLPWEEMDELSKSGLLGITVPRQHGGAGVSTRTLAEVFRLLATADPNIAQIPQSHFVYVNVLRESGTPRQQGTFYARVLAGERFGNAQADARGRTAQDVVTRLVPDGDGYVLTGTKKYATGALLAHWIPVLARDQHDMLRVAYVAAGARGVTVVDDWNGMGQRTTASGTVLLEGVHVPAENVVAHHRTFERPQVHGALSQLLHTAIDVGIARAALDEAVDFVRTRSRPWGDSGAATAAEDVLTLQRFGDLAVRLRSAEALLDTAAGEIDSARSRLDDETAAAASISVAAAKAVADGAAIELTNALFEVAGTRSSLDELNLHRHWRNARTHTLHDPVRWKYQHIGRYVLNGTHPPRNSQI